MDMKKESREHKSQVDEAESITYKQHKQKIENKTVKKNIVTPMRLGNKREKRFYLHV